jgi:transposase InsO family protein
MADNGVDCSMSRSGNVWDNAAAESFFSSLEIEWIGRTVYRTRDPAKADVSTISRDSTTRSAGTRPTAAQRD